MSAKRATAEASDSPWAVTILPGKVARTPKPAKQPKEPKEPRPAREARRPRVGRRHDRRVDEPAAPIESLEVTQPEPANLQPVAAMAAVAAVAAVAATGFASTSPAAPSVPDSTAGHSAAGHSAAGHRTAGYPPAGPDQPTDADDATDPAARHETPRGDVSSRRTKVLLVIGAVVVVAAGGYVGVPKLLHHSSSPTIVVGLPARVGTFARVTDQTTLTQLQHEAAGMRTADPALAAAGLAEYKNPQGEQFVAAIGHLPAATSASNAAQQLAIISRVNRELTASGAKPDTLAAVPPGTLGGQLWCGHRTDDPSSPAGPDCISVDKDAIVLISVYGAPDSSGAVLTRATRLMAEQRS